MKMHEALYVPWKQNFKFNVMNQNIYIIFLFDLLNITPKLVIYGSNCFCYFTGVNWKVKLITF